LHGATLLPVNQTSSSRRFRARCRRCVNLLIGAFLILWIGTSAWHVYKPLPEGLGQSWPVRPADQVEFLADYTWVDGSGHRHFEHRIFDRQLALIEQAETLIVLDKFLFNDFAGDPDGEGLRSLSTQLGSALIRRKQARPAIRIVFITDPINNQYGGMHSPLLDDLRSNGIDVVVTDLDRLRDSNPVWSGFWRLCCRWWGNDPDGGWLPSPVGSQPVTLRSWLRLANFKANHRKTLIVDSGENWTGLITSANPHDASSAHGNMAVQFTGPAALDLLASERAIVAFSAPDKLWSPPAPRASRGQTTGTTQVQILTESAILDAVIDLLDRSQSGDSVDLAMFYLSHRRIVEALLAAQSRGSTIRILLDPNEHAFGRRKNGVPNRPVAAELNQAGIEVRWCHTHGEQCHSKFLLVRFDDGRAEMIGGTANYTRRNLNDLNPETAVRVLGPSNDSAMQQAADYFERRWNNENGQVFNVPYEHYADESRRRYWQYRFMEATGLSTF
jgi:phosphatidylserine/phosphatidylglycerophosphate/cardiolipin synthase-like enzyme